MKQVYTLREGATFEEFYERYVPLVRALVSRALVRPEHRENIDDIIQQVWIKIWRAYPGLDLSQAHNYWVTVIVQNTITDFFRKEQRRDHFFVHYDEEFLAQTITDQGWEEKQQFLDAVTGYERVYHSLTDQDRFIIDMLLGEYKQTEIARALGVTKQQIRYAIVRAQRPFRRYAGLPTNALRKRKTGV